MQPNFSFVRTLNDPLEVLPAEALKILWDRSPTLETKATSWQNGNVNAFGWYVREERNAKRFDKKGDPFIVPRVISVHRVLVKSKSEKDMIVFEDTKRGIRSTNKPMRLATKTGVTLFLRKYRAFDGYPVLPKMDTDMERCAKMFGAFAVEFHIYA